MPRFSGATRGGLGYGPPSCHSCMCGTVRKQSSERLGNELQFQAEFELRINSVRHPALVGAIPAGISVRCFGAGPFRIASKFPC